MAQPVLGEKVSGVSWAAIVIGLIGVLIMVRPGADVFKYTALLPICAAFMYAAMQMVTRKLGMQDSAATLTFYIQISFILVSTSMGLIVGDGKFNTGHNPTFEFLLREWTIPTLNHFKLLAICGFVVAIGGYLMSQAYRIAQASIVAPFEYTSLPIALLIGLLVWGDWPDATSFIGCGFIVLGGLIIALFDKQETLATRKG